MADQVAEQNGFFKNWEQCVKIFTNLVPEGVIIKTVGQFLLATDIDVQSIVRPGELCSRWWTRITRLIVVYVVFVCRGDPTYGIGVNYRAFVTWMYGILGKLKAESSSAFAGAEGGWWVYARERINYLLATEVELVTRVLAFTGYLFSLPLKLASIAGNAVGSVVKEKVSFLESTNFESPYSFWNVATQFGGMMKCDMTISQAATAGATSVKHAAELARNRAVLLSPVLLPVYVEQYVQRILAQFCDWNLYRGIVTLTPFVRFRMKYYWIGDLHNARRKWAAFSKKANNAVIKRAGEDPPTDRIMDLIVEEDPGCGVKRCLTEAAPSCNKCVSWVNGCAGPFTNRKLDASHFHMNRSYTLLAFAREAVQTTEAWRIDAIGKPGLLHERTVEQLPPYPEVPVRKPTDVAILKLIAHRKEVQTEKKPLRLIKDTAMAFKNKIESVINKDLKKKCNYQTKAGKRCARSASMAASDFGEDVGFCKIHYKAWLKAKQNKQKHTKKWIDEHMPGSVLIGDGQTMGRVVTIQSLRI